MLPPTGSDQSYPPPAAAPRRVFVRRQQGAPVVTYSLMGVTIGIYLLQMFGVFVLGEDYLALMGMKMNSLIENGQFWRLITPVFLHDNSSFLHIAFNMYALYALGPGLERHYGRWRFLALYFLAGFAGNVLSFIFSPNPSWGASTAIFGLLGAEGVFLYKNRSLFGEMGRQALINVVVIAAINLFIGLSPGIDNWGHIGGLIGGALFAWFAGPSYQLQTTYSVEYGPSSAPALVDQNGPGKTVTTFLVIWALFLFLAAWEIIF